MPVVSQSIISPIVPVGASADAWALRYRAARPGRSPRPTPASPRQHRLGHELGVDLVGRRAVLADHAEHRVPVRRVARERAGRSAISALVRYAWPVISAVMAPAQARPPSESYGRPRAISGRPGSRSRARAGGSPSRSGRSSPSVARVADDDLLRREHDLDRVLEGRVSNVRLVQELQQVEAGQVAGAVVEVHVLAARIGRVDAAAAGPCATR